MRLVDRGDAARARLRWAERNREYLSMANAQWRRLDRKRHPGRYRARRAVERAVVRGELESPIRCQRCRVGSLRLEAHHADYRKALCVAWLCPDCHHTVHSSRGVGESLRI
jgi:hypothetical protein